MLGDFNINLCPKWKYIFQDDKVLSPREIHKFVKEKDSYTMSFNTRNFVPFTSSNNWSRLPTEYRKTNHLYLIMSSWKSSPVSGAIDIGVPYIPKPTVKRQIKMRSLQNYTIGAFHQLLSNVPFPNTSFFIIIYLFIQSHFTTFKGKILPLNEKGQTE